MAEATLPFKLVPAIFKAGCAAHPCLRRWHSGSAAAPCCQVPAHPGQELLPLASPSHPMAGRELPRPCSVTAPRGELLPTGVPAQTQDFLPKVCRHPAARKWQSACNKTQKPSRHLHPPQPQPQQQVPASQDHLREKIKSLSFLA